MSTVAPLLPFICRKEDVGAVLYEDLAVMCFEDANPIQRASCWAGWWISRNFGGALAVDRSSWLEWDSRIAIRLPQGTLLITPDASLGTSYIGADEADARLVLDEVLGALRGVVPTMALDDLAP